MDSIFDNIYINKIWNANIKSIPLSGPGSDITITKELMEYLDNLKGISSVLDIGCGDLTWIRKTKFFNKKYIGIDISSYIVNENKKRHPTINFHCINAINGKLFDADLFICRDVMFHLNREDNLNLLKNISKYKFKYIILTSCNNDINKFSIDNKDRYCSINLEIEPFNFKNFEHTINEKKFNRKIIVLSYENFMNLISKI